MNKVDMIRQIHDNELENYCRKNNVSFTSICRLLDAEKTKKLLRRNSLIQQVIDKEIDNAIDNENR